jgi:hypothetical protein
MNTPKKFQSWKMLMKSRYCSSRKFIASTQKKSLTIQQDTKRATFSKICLNKCKISSSWHNKKKSSFMKSHKFCQNWLLWKKNWRGLRIKAVSSKKSLAKDRKICKNTMKSFWPFELEKKRIWSRNWKKKLLLLGQTLRNNRTGLRQNCLYQLASYWKLNKSCLLGQHSSNSWNYQRIHGFKRRDSMRLL